MKVIHICTYLRDFLIILYFEILYILALRAYIIYLINLTSLPPRKTRNFEIITILIDSTENFRQFSSWRNRIWSPLLEIWLKISIDVDCEQCWCWYINYIVTKVSQITLNWSKLRIYIHRSRAPLQHLCILSDITAAWSLYYVRILQ